MSRWSKKDCECLAKVYPSLGLAASAEIVGRSVRATATKASELGLTLDQEGPFFKAYQERAAAAKVGKKRPAQATVMKRLHDEGRLHTAQWHESQAKHHERMRGVKPACSTKGMKFSEEIRARVGAASRRNAAKMTDDKWLARCKKAAATRAARGTTYAGRKASWRAAWRDIGGQRIFARSRWEANYARWLEHQRCVGQILRWEHEPETFWFEGIKRGCVSYLPDFRVTLLDGSLEYHEVKGWMDARSKTKIERMGRYHPAVTLVVIDAKAYAALEHAVHDFVKDWERSE